MIVVVYVCDSSIGEGEEDFEFDDRTYLKNKKEGKKEKLTKMKGWWLVS